MNSTVYESILAGHRIRYKFRFPDTHRLFQGQLKRSLVLLPDIETDSDTLEIARKQLPEGSLDSYVEYRTMIPKTARFLLQYNACIFHSVSFIHNGYAWLLTAPSGTGKTTQFFNWSRLYPGEIKMISGDMPIISKEDDGHLHVWPTCWNGKENLGSMENAPLGGIIYLRQGAENRIEMLSVQETIRLFMPQFIVIPENEEDVLKLTGLLEQIIKSVPIRLFVNRGDDGSTNLLRTTIHEIRMGK